jgi:hypothetical protein
MKLGLNPLLEVEALSPAKAGFIILGIITPGSAALHLGLLSFVGSRRLAAMLGFRT